MRRIVIATVSAILAAGAVRADDASVEVIKKAIKAHGGAENLQKSLSSRGKVRATVYRDGTPITGEVEFTSRLPDYERLTMTDVDNDPTKMIRVVAKKAVFFKYGDDYIELSDTAQAAYRTALQIEYACTLVPLLADNVYSLTLADEQKIGACKATGIRVQKGKELDVILYFDNATGLLVKSMSQEGAGQAAVKKEVRHISHKEIDGVVRPTKIEIFHNGKLFQTNSLREVKYGQDIKDSEFAKP